MRNLLQTLLGWLEGLRLPLPEPYEPGVADRELDGLPQPASPAPKPPAPKPASETTSRRTVWSQYRADYRTWEELALVLLSGRAPEGMTVDGNLTLAKLRVRALPGGFCVRGDLDLRQCQRLAHIGHGLDVRGHLLIGGRCSQPLWWEQRGHESARSAVLRSLSHDAQCPLVELPAGLRVGTNLTLRQCRRLQRLPDDLRIGGSIRLESASSLESLPDQFVVRGDLAISGAPRLTALPAGLRVEGSLRLIGVRIDRLPDDLRIGGDLVLECCQRLTELPGRLEVGGSLIVRRCPIRRLPAGLRIGRDLRLHRIADLAGLPEGLSVPGRLELVRCPALRAIAPGLSIGTDLIVRRCEALRELPRGLQVPGTLGLSGCPRLDGLPAGLSLGTSLVADPMKPALRLADCPALGSLPEDLGVGGPIEVAGSGLRDLPDSLARTVQLLWRGVLVPPEVVFRPETLAPERILGERNAELRRIMLERVGLDEVLRRSKAAVLDSDRDPGGDRRLVRIGLPGWLGISRYRCYLHCRCPSTAREYLLRVPPDTRTCREAAAWLAGFDDPDAYRPVLET